MSEKTVIEMAREAGILEPIELLESNQWRQDTLRELERFASLVRAAEQKKWQDQAMVDIHEAVLEEREACAKVCDDIFRHWLQTDPDEQFATPDADDCARAIRSRSSEH